MNYVQDNQLRNDISIFFQEKFKENQFPFAESLQWHFNVFSNDSYHNIKYLTVCMEILILALDIIDDIQDHDNEESAWTKIGQSSSLNVAISLLTISQLHILEYSNNTNSLKTILKYLSKAIEGQHQDLDGNIDSADQYINMIKLKSGSLIAMANILGASFTGSEYSNIKIIEEYSYDLGVVAQIANDIHDVIKFEEKNDWKLKKKTLPIIYMLNPLIKEGEIVRSYYNGEISFETLLSYKEEIIDSLKQSGALNYTVAQKILYEQRALNKIETLPISPEKIKILKEHLL